LDYKSRRTGLSSFSFSSGLTLNVLLWHQGRFRRLGIANVSRMVLDEALKIAAGADGKVNGGATIGATWKDGSDEAACYQPALQTLAKGDGIGLCSAARLRRHEPTDAVGNGGQRSSSAGSTSALLVDPHADSAALVAVIPRPSATRTRSAYTVEERYFFFYSGTWAAPCA